MTNWRGQTVIATLCLKNVVSLQLKWNHKYDLLGTQVQPIFYQHNENILMFKNILTLNVLVKSPKKTYFFSAKKSNSAGHHPVFLAAALLKVL